MNIALTVQRLGFDENEEHVDWEEIRLWIAEELSKYTEHKCVYCGMANGCDIALGLVVTRIKDVGGDINLNCVLPCKEYNCSHPYYHKLKAYADEWIELSDAFYKGCDNVRDQYMIDNCDILLAVWDGNKSGGVWSTIRKAQKAGKKIVHCPGEYLQKI